MFYLKRHKISILTLEKTVAIEFFNSLNNLLKLFGMLMREEWTAETFGKMEHFVMGGCGITNHSERCDAAVMTAG